MQQKFDSMLVFSYIYRLVVEFVDLIVGVNEKKNTHNNIVLIMTSYNQSPCKQKMFRFHIKTSLIKCKIILKCC